MMHAANVKYRVNMTFAHIFPPTHYSCLNSLFGHARVLDLFVSLFVHENPAQSISAQAFVSLVWSPLKDMNSQPEDRKRKLAELESKIGEEISKEIDDLEERAAKLDREIQQFEREKSSMRALQAKGGDVL